MVPGSSYHFYRVLWAMILGCPVVTAAAQEFETLPGDRFPVTNVLQNRTGFLWVGTVIGLYRYDGYEYQVYRHAAGDSTSIPSNYINVNAMAEDNDGHLWVGTRAGVGRFDPATEQFRTYHHVPGGSTGLPHDRVNAVLVARDSTVWAGTNEGMARYDPVADAFVVVPYTSPSYEKADPVIALAEDAAGYLWLGTTRGLKRLNPKSGAVELFMPSITDTVWSLHVDASGSVWVGTMNGTVYRLDPATQAFETVDLFDDFEVDAGGGYVIDLFQDTAGRMWVGTWNGGLFVYDPDMDQWMHHLDGLPNNSVSAFYEDRSGKQWVGTWNGLAHVRSMKAFDHLGVPEVGDVPATSVAVDSAGGVWVGTSGYGAWYLNETTGERRVLKTDATEGPLTSNDVSSVAVDAKQRVWLGTSGGGINRFEPQTGEVTYYLHHPENPTGPPDNMIYKIFPDGAERVWVGTVSSGLAVWDEATDAFTLFGSNHNTVTPNKKTIPMASNEVWTVYRQGTDHMWAGTIAGGLHAFRRAVPTPAAPTTLAFDVQRYSHAASDPTSISSDDVVTLYQEGDSILWVGTMGGGFNKMDMDSETFVTYGVEDGLPNAYVGCILPDEQGRLWISTRAGLARFEPAREAFTVYTPADGLRSSVFFPDGCVRNEEGRLYFAGDAGVTAFHPSGIIDNPAPPPVSLTQVYLFNAPLRMDSSAVSKRLLRLPYDRNFLSFEFAALDFNIPEKNRYAYRLDGLDPGWVESGASRRADYPNLQPGSYSLYVRASNNDGVWSDDHVLLHVVITPPYWERTWFRLLLFLAIAAMVAAVVGYRRKKQRELQQTREQIADDLHDDIGSKLGALGLFMGRLQRKGRLTEGDLRRVEQHVGSIERMTGDLRDVVWLVQPRHDTLRSFCIRLGETARLLAGDVDLVLDLADVPEHVQLPMNTRRHLYLMAREALFNALRHGQASRIELQITYDKPSVRITIADNGVGFDMGTVEKGQGLLTIPHRARKIGARLAIDTAPGAGTRVMIEVNI